MNKSIPLLWRLLGVIRTRIDNYTISEKWFKKHKNQSIFFIQIGANDGVTQDPIYKYSDKWSGILVEPLTKMVASLNDNYSKHHGQYYIENLAISDYNGEISLYCPKNLKENEWQTKIASVNKSSGLLKDFNLDEVIVQCITLNELIIRYNVTYIDLLILDVEGFEMTIMNAYNFSILPKAIYFEIRFYCYDDIVKIFEKFHNLGYRIFPEKDNVFMVLK